MQIEEPTGAHPRLVAPAVAAFGRKTVAGAQGRGRAPDGQKYRL